MRFKDYNQRQLFIYLPEYDTLFPKGSVQRVIDNFVNSIDLSDVLDTYLPGGAPPYHPSVILKIVLYAYSKNIYGCRPISDLCRYDLVCQWFCNFENPSPSTINRFRSEHLGLERTVDIFIKLVRILLKDGLVSFEQCTYVDGTTIESRASRTKLVWTQSIRRFAEGNTKRIEELMAAARTQQQLDKDEEDAKGNPSNGNDSQPKDNVAGSEPVSDAGVKNDATVNNEAKDTGKKKRDKDVHMSSERVEDIRKQIESGELQLTEGKKNELIERLNRADRYRHEDELCDDKSGTAITDPDSVAMHPKDDVRHIGPCLPMYNLQLMTQSQFILWGCIFGKASDMSAFAPFLSSIPDEFIPSRMAADAGYGSTENILLAQKRNITPFFKYALYEKECAPNFKENTFLAEYMPELPDGNLKCPGGTLVKQRETVDECNGVTTTTVYYHTDDCAQCPLRSKCHGKNLRDYRDVKRKKEWAQLKPVVKANLNSEEGQQLLRQRSKDVEPTFAHTKWNGAYKRLRHFGSVKCMTDLFIRFIAHNLKKYVRAINVCSPHNPEIPDDPNKTKKQNKSHSDAHIFVFFAFWSQLADIFWKFKKNQNKIRFA